MLSSLDFHYVLQGADKLLSGLVITIELSAIVMLISTFAGFIVAILVMAPVRLIRWPVRAYIEIFRCTPALVQIVWFFYCAPLLLNVFWDPFTMGVIALTLNLTAYNAEAYRAAIQAIPASHHDAAIALGLSRFDYYRDVVFPQALRMAVPVLLTNTIGMIQQSALVALVSVEDLMYQGKMLAIETYRPIETLTTVALIYFALAYALSGVVGLVQRRLAVTTAG